MTWLAPWALAGGALGMLGVIAAHMLSRQRPRALALATARFLPAGMLEATTLQRTPMDRWWMLLRLLILGLLAAGVAQPVITATRVQTRTVLLLDRTLSVKAQRAAIGTLAPTDVVIAFDSVATLSAAGSVSPVATRFSSLSVALAALVRTRDSLLLGATQLRVVAVSRFSPKSLNVMTRSLRAMLPDSIIVVPASAVAGTASARGPIRVHAAGDDAVAATAVLIGDSVAAAGSLIVRSGGMSAEDSAAASNGATVVVWPARATQRGDTLAALTVGSTTWIAPLSRDTIDVPRAGQAIGWWADGTPAVWESRAGAGCVLQVRAALPSAGDQTLSLAAQAWLAALITACDRDTSAAGEAPAWIAAPSAPTTTLARRSEFTSQFAPWLVGAALLLAAAELVLRPRARG